ncbi:hypothetical protein B5F09_12090 [Erysipelatoclostridium sp. An173]|uniref:AAA domain-containing protein n=1 Tax=Erysipelatoclostridium sp. An173 TaxID=1965571 RepID=UPI000B39B6E0|nr:AAA domain-containing protein [Erysipelatoclostridium sp. An173]OUP72999.1 hypothetical protein B5F09_12090 [Erysipelatoclostridium sp. An173]
MPLCPIHKTQLLSTNETILQNNNGVIYHIPVFFCKTCSRYYAIGIDHEHEPGLVKVFKNSSIIYVSSFAQLKNSENSDAARVMEKNKQKNSKKENSKKKMKNKNHNNGGNTIIIHRFKSNKEAHNLVDKFNKIGFDYPQLMVNDKSINEIITKIFVSGINQSCVIRNMSVIQTKNNDEFVVRKIQIYNTESSFLNAILPDNIYLTFDGRIKKSELWLEDVNIIESPEKRENDITIRANFVFNKVGSNCLYDLITLDNTKAMLNKTVSELKLWDDYLEWKEQLSLYRMSALKYLSFYIDFDEYNVHFLTVSDYDTDLKNFKRYLNRNEVSVYGNNSSKDRWKFKAEIDIQSTTNSGVILDFISNNGSINVENIDFDIWDECRTYVSFYNENNLTLEECIRSIEDNYEMPTYQELVFKLPDTIIELLEIEKENNLNIGENLVRRVYRNFDVDGFIATSQLGDIVLNKRLKKAINDLKIGNTVSQRLDKWLFDINKAKLPENIEDINNWLNPNLNEPQKNAVRKMVSAPDVCLLQGPPGTGKTTVIAEAIFQFVSQNKRVLVASQANLAVDNALERLILLPNIRAVRLGNERKIDKSVTKITEDNVLLTFYDSLRMYIQNRYIDCWDNIDVKLRDLDTLKLDYQHLKLKINGNMVQLGIIEEKLNELDKRLQELSKDRRRFENNIIQYRLLTSYPIKDISILTDDELIIILKKCSSIVNELFDNSIYLIPSKLDDSILKISRNNILRDLITLLFNNLFRIDSIIEKCLNSSITTNNEVVELNKTINLLQEKMLSSGKQEDFIAWKKVKDKLEVLSLNQNFLTDEESRIFNIKSDSNNIKDTVLKAFDKNSYQIGKLKEIIDNHFEDIISVLSNLIGNIKKEEKKLRIDFEKLSNDKNELLLQKNELEKKKTEFYGNHSEDIDFDELIKEKKKELLSLNNEGKILRKEWEPFFKDLNQWIEGIPDYQQEKEIYLKDYINGCNVVGISCTENSKTLIENGFDNFDVLIIDEVSKATPPELLLPMLRARKTILVGDHRQLPPLFNEHEKSYYDLVDEQEFDNSSLVELKREDFEKYKDLVTASLFERYFENADNSIKETLTYQYRMHSDIMQIINMFYDNSLIDGNNSLKNPIKEHGLTISSINNTPLITPNKHAYWIDSSSFAGHNVYESRRDGSTSAENRLEAEIIIEMLDKMEQEYLNKNIKIKVQVGVISFYYDQVILIRRLLKNKTFYTMNIDVNTVDRFQGKEKSIVFVSLVRNVKSHIHNNNSHIAAFQRINVAFSRAKELLVIIGAKDMYAEQPVLISNMNTGEEKELMIYRHILEMLNSKGALFYSDDVLPKTYIENIFNLRGESNDI